MVAAAATLVVARVIKKERKKETRPEQEGMAMPTVV